MNIKCVGTGTFMNCKTRNKKIFFILRIRYHCTQTFSFPSLRCFFLSSLSFTFLCFFFGLTSSPSTSTISPDSKTILCVRTGKTSSSLKGLSNKHKFLSYCTYTCRFERKCPSEQFNIRSIFFQITRYKI